MKSLLLAATVMAFSAVNLSPALAADARNAGTAAGTPHYEWQYHYVGHHPRYEGHWVLVR